MAEAWRDGYGAKLMCEPSERLKEQWVYESIADPDCTGWNCPTCGYSNYHVFGLEECERCGYQLDQDRVRDSLQERAENLMPDGSKMA
jgi:ribosomal protein L37E